MERLKQYMGFFIFLPSYPSWHQTINKLATVFLHESFIYPSYILHDTEAAKV